MTKSMKPFQKHFFLSMIAVLTEYKRNKEKDGFIPTVELLIEELTDQLSSDIKNENNQN